MKLLRALVATPLHLAAFLVAVVIWGLSSLAAFLLESSNSLMAYTPDEVPPNTRQVLRYLKGRCIKCSEPRR